MYRFAVILLFLITVYSCNNEAYKTDPSGLEYMFFEHNPDAQKPKQDDILVLRLRYATESDSVLFDTKEIQGPFRMKVKTPSHTGGSIEDAFLLMNVGDSARFRIDAFNFFTYSKQAAIPNFVKKGEKLVFDIRLVKIFNYKEWLEENNSVKIKNEEEEMELLKSYLERASIKIEPTASGLYYIEEKAGKGAAPVTGDVVTLHYIGSFIDGRPFDSSYKNNNPLKFRLGTNDVIPGLEEGVKLMKEGGKATMVIPSKIAYGEHEYGPVAPYSTLVFEIELLSVEHIK